MNELSERAKELARELEMVTYPHSEHVIDKLEQALLAERRLALIEMAEALESGIPTMPITTMLRKFADDPELFRATPRGGE